jgi:hypothetical protein
MKRSFDVMNNNNEIQEILESSSEEEREDNFEESVEESDSEATQEQQSEDESTDEEEAQNDSMSASVSSIADPEDTIRMSLYLDSDGVVRTAEEMNLLASSSSIFFSLASLERVSSASTGSPDLLSPSSTGSAQAGFQFLNLFWNDIVDSTSQTMRTLQSIERLEAFLVQTGSNNNYDQSFGTGNLGIIPDPSPLVRHQASNSGLFSFQLDPGQRYHRPSRRRRLAPRMIRRFVEDEPSVSLERTVTFSETEYDMASDYFNTLVWSQYEDVMDFVRPTQNVLNVILEFWQSTNRESMPLWDQLIEMIVSEIMTFHEIDLTEEDLQIIVEHYLSTQGYLPSPMDYNIIHEYFLLHNEYPSDDEILDMTRRTLMFFMNPEAFHQQDKVHVPALHIDKIPRFQNTETGISCSICQDEIGLNQMVLRLPPCQHTYHGSSEDCLENACVLNWLSENNTCPMCKTKVQVKLEVKLEK